METKVGYTSPETLSSSGCTEPPPGYSQVSLSTSSSQNPKRLPTQYPEDQTVRLLLSIFIGSALSLTIGALSVWACVVVYHYAPSGQLYENDCEGRTASAAERLFLINIRITQDLSFPQAKLVDLAWDSIIGHGGRMLHGWLLYQVVARCLTWIMENSAIPGHFNLSLLFDTVSLESIWSCATFIFQKKPARTTVTVLWFIFAISYAIAYPTIWAAATGYLAPSYAVYTFPGQASMVENPTALNFCWTFDSERVGPNISSVVTGPTVQQLTDGSDNPNITDSWYLFGNGLTGADFVGSTDFHNLYAYAMGRYTLWNVSLYIHNNFNGSMDLYYYLEDFRKASPIDTLGVDHRYFYTRQKSYEGGYPSTVNGWHFAGADQLGVGGPPGFSLRLPDFEIRNTTFVLNEDMISSKWGVVPYNSTLWWSGEQISLEAPFLQIGAYNGSRCDWFNTPLAVCLCLGNSPIMADWRTDDNIRCISEVGYIWGFSSTVLFLGTVLETIWLLGCWIWWSVASLGSRLVRYGRPGTGRVRNILDIAGAVTAEIGHDTGIYSDARLYREVKKCPPVGYEVGEGKDWDQIRLISRRMSTGSQQQLKIQLRRRYA